MRGLLIILLFVLTFAAGYFIGGSGTKEIKSSYLSLKEEMSAKTRGLEAEISSTRVRLNLVEARDFLGSARESVKEKNFGEAEREIDKAKERVAKAISLAPEQQKKNLAPIQSEIESIKGDILKLNAKAAGRIEAVEKELEKIAA